ncbi:MAG TPA: hypothetical protein VN729_04540 [Ktedonobacteraceae bacterium]|nr:hypothetical protein [Ktedonobacteraceae bacterium]
MTLLQGASWHTWTIGTGVMEQVHKSPVRYLPAGDGLPLFWRIESLGNALWHTVRRCREPG